MSVINTKKLEAAHQRWQRKVLKISWKDMISNKVVRERTGQDTLESIIRECRLRWFGHAYRIDFNRIARQALDWIPLDFKKKDLDLLGLTWDEALDLTKDCSKARDCTARCAFTARGRTNIIVVIIHEMHDHQQPCTPMHPVYCNINSFTSDISVRVSNVFPLPSLAQ